MAFATAGPNQYLVIGQHGQVTNRGTGVQTFLWPGTTYVLIPSTKQEATFEMTQETRDGIPMRFKGIVIYRITDPVTAAMNFNFSDETGLEEINALINNICLGELRAVVAGMTMQECVEQRKTVLTASVDRALREVVMNQSDGARSRWGIDLELVQVAQVFVIDAALRKQLEAEVRNEIRSKSDQADIRTQQEVGLAQIAADRQIREQKQLTEKDAIRQNEELEMANLQVRSRLQKQNLEIEKEIIQQAAEKFKLEMETAKEKEETETPVRMLQIENQHAVLNRELEMRLVENQVHEQVVKHDMLLEKVRQELKKELLPLEQAPLMADSLSKVFNNAHLSFVGSENQVLASFLPLIQLIAEAVKDGMAVSDPNGKG